MKIKVTNLNPVDVIIDINGDNKTEDKVIVHPKNSESLDIKSSVFSQIKGTKGLVVQVLTKEPK